MRGSLSKKTNSQERYLEGLTSQKPMEGVVEQCEEANEDEN